MQTHIIGKQIIELGLGTEQDAFAMQQEISWVLKNQVMPRLEALLDRMISPDIVIRMDELEIDLGYINPDNLERDFADKLLQHFEEVLIQKLEEIGNATGHTKAQKIPLKLSILDAWKYYLEKGYMPWWVEEKDWNAWEKKIILALSNSSSNIISQLLSLNISKEALIQRIVWQFSQELPISLIRTIDPGLEHLIQELVRDMSLFLPELPKINIQVKEAQSYFWIKSLTLLFDGKLKGLTKTEIVRAFFGEIGRKKNITYKKLLQQACELSLSDVRIGEPKPPAYLEKILIQSWKEISTEGKIEIDKQGVNLEAKKGNTPSKSDLTLPNPDVKTSRSTVEEGNTIYIQNAGIVLVHPFLPILFEELAYTRSKEFVDESSRHRAVHLVQYLANGKFEAHEPALTLNKLLCGMPLNMPVKQQIELTDAEKEEADHLLETVIGHWKALKNTSPDGLRYNYFLREGKLAFTEMGWKLQVEQKTQDIMLGRLPWGISMVKMPWMLDILRVEWN